MSQPTLIDELKAFQERNADFLSMTHVYTNEEWLQRKEEYGNRALCVVTTEDCLYDGLNYGGDCSMFADEFIAILKRHGHYSEPAYAWMQCIYPLDGPKLTPKLELCSGLV